MTGASVAPAGRIRQSRARQRSDARQPWPFGGFLLESLGLCGRGLSIAGAPSGVMRTRAARKWVARCTVPGLKWTAQRVDRMGASWRDQTSHIPLRMRLCSSSINSCRWNCQFFPLYFTRNCGCRMPEIQAARADPRKQVGRYLCTGRDGLLRSAPMRKTLRVCCRQ
jgi:hypothetical protein